MDKSFQKRIFKYVQNFTYISTTKQQPQLWSNKSSDVAKSGHKRYVIDRREVLGL